jgi:nitroreductase
MDTIEAIRTRRSIRSYKITPVGRDLVESIVQDAAYAPPPFSGQMPWTFNVVEGVDRIATYGERAKRYTQEHRADEPGWDWLDRTDFKIFWDAPVLVVISGRAEDCCRAGQNLMLSAHARGLGTCWVGSPMLWLRTAEAKAELGIPESLTPVSALCLGYAETVPVAPVRAQPTIIWAQ